MPLIKKLIFPALTNSFRSGEAQASGRVIPQELKQTAIHWKLIMLLVKQITDKFCNRLITKHVQIEKELLKKEKNNKEIKIMD